MRWQDEVGLAIMLGYLVRSGYIMVEIMLSVAS